MADKNIWNDWKINIDVVLVSVYVIWMLLETKVSKSEISKGNNTIVLSILVEEKTLFRIAGYSEFSRLRKRLVPFIW